MRWLIALIVILLAIFHFMKEPEPRPIEETFIGNQVKVLKDAENYESDYLKSVDEAKRKMEEEIEKSGG